MNKSNTDFKKDWQKCVWASHIMNSAHCEHGHLCSIVYLCFIDFTLAAIPIGHE